MICYKDRTFCISDNCTCGPNYKYTEEIGLAAEKFGLPVAVAYFCDEPKEDEDGSQ